MSAARHTPGPWTVGGIASVKGTDSSDIYIQDRRMACVAHVIYNEPGGDDPAECMADARLIASAPDLLDALKYLAGEEYSANHDEFYASKDHENCKVCKIRALIAKAEGGPQ